jgi:molybdenum cofactor cytidylyltransferase
VSQPDPERNARAAPAAVILAAGASSRMGSPKALLRMPGPGEPETFLDRLIASLGAHCAPVIVVLGHDAEAIRAGARRPALFVLNEDYAAGQLSSLQCGLRAAPAASGGAMFTPVDHALVAERTIGELVAAFRRRPERPPVVAPRHDGRHGHPVCCAREVIDELLALPRGAQARDALGRRRAGTLYLDVDDPAVLLDIDDREAYARALEAARR